MSKLSQLLNQAGDDRRDEEWAHYARVQAQHREIIALLEATAEEERAILQKAGGGRRLTLIPFSGEARRVNEERHRAEAELEHVRQRIAEENKILSDNEQRLHAELHEWLLGHDPVYRKSGDVIRLFSRVRESVSTLVNLLTDMRSRYGAAGNELAVSFDHRNHTLSDVSHAALDNLLAAHERLDVGQRAFAATLAELNALVDGSIYRELKLPAYAPVGSPECRKGMSYPELHANFETGAARVSEALERLDEDYTTADPASARLDAILHRYRDNLWRQHREELDSGGPSALAG